ncbi:hypothetical protein V4P56_04895 [Bartonella sp. B35(2025)]
MRERGFITPGVHSADSNILPYIHCAVFLSTQSAFPAYSEYSNGIRYQLKETSDNAEDTSRCTCSTMIGMKKNQFRSLNYDPNLKNKEVQDYSIFVISTCAR